MVKPKKDKKTGKMKRPAAKITDVMVLSAIVVGLVVWYIATTYSGTNCDKIYNSTEGIIMNSNKSSRQGGGGIQQPHKAYKLSDDILNDSQSSTQSYNLVKTGINMPNKNISIPKVLVDYKE